MNASESDWWDYTNGYLTNNYALRTLTSIEDCVKGENTGAECLWLVKRLVRQFIFVLDQACFDESTEALSERLKLMYVRDTVSHYHAAPRERLVRCSVRFFGSPKPPRHRTLRVEQGLKHRRLFSLTGVQGPNCSGMACLSSDYQTL